MQKLYILLMTLFFINCAMAQTDQYCVPCLGQGIQFITQAQIDSFPINYPNCTQIEGEVQIGVYSGSMNITNLNGLSVLTSLGTDMEIFFCDALTSLTGLDNVTSIGGDLWIDDCDTLTNLTGLDNVTLIGGNIYINYNDALTSLIGLGNVTSIGGDLNIDGCYALTSLSGLDKVTSIGGYLRIVGEPVLTNLTGLNNVTSIGGLIIKLCDALTTLTGLENVTSSVEPLVIEDNDALTSLTGLDNIEGGSIDYLIVTNNALLSTCEVKSICEYLASPNDTSEIHDNATGCNSKQEVELACGVGIEQNDIFENYLNIFPNPTSTNIIIETNSKGFLSILNLNCQEIIMRQITEHKTLIDISNLPSSVYILRYQNENIVKIEKIIKQ